jgi:hypothetical protein
MVGITAATAVAYYRIERERRLEEAMGKVVSSESDGMWTPRPDYLAKRKFVATKNGWFPIDDVSCHVAVLLKSPACIESSHSPGWSFLFLSFTGVWSS